MKKVLAALILAVAAMPLLAAMGLVATIYGIAAEEGPYSAVGGTAKRLVEVAAAEVGTQGGSKYIGALHPGSEQAYSGLWCCVFVMWCANEAGLCGDGGVLDPSLGSNWAVEAYFREHPEKGTIYYPCDGEEVEPQPGDILLFFTGKGSSWDHVCLCESFEDGQIHTIEGNYGDAVARATYGKSALGGLISVVVRPRFPKAGTGASQAGTNTQGENMVGSDLVENQYFSYSAPSRSLSCQWDLSDDGTLDAGIGHPCREVWEKWRDTGFETDEYGVEEIDGKLLVACTNTYGVVGDWITFYFEDGTAIEAIMMDTKSQGDANWDAWGHISAGALGVLELEVLPRAEGGPGCNAGTPGCHPEWAGHYITSWTNHDRVIDSISGTYRRSPDWGLGMRELIDIFTAGSRGANAGRDPYVAQVSWKGDLAYLAKVGELAASVGSPTDYFIFADYDLCRMVVLEHASSGKWRVRHCWNGNFCQNSFAGVHHVEEKQPGNVLENSAILSDGTPNPSAWSTCYIMCYTYDAPDTDWRLPDGRAHDCAAIHTTDHEETGYANRGCLGILRENAKWVYDNVPLGTTVYIVEGGI